VLHDEFVRKQLASDSKLALIVPAFQIRQQCKSIDLSIVNPDQTEPECREENIPRVPRTMDDLTELLVSHKASAFDPTNRGGHGSTSYREWFRMEDGDLWDIPCILSNRYEPYLAARYCTDYPPYQEVFTGYGKNKMTVRLCWVILSLFVSVCMSFIFLVLILMLDAYFSSFYNVFHVSVANYANETYRIRLFSNRRRLCMSLSSPHRRLT